jgi:hypothetical protein
MHGEGEVVYVWNEIKDSGNGHLEFTQQRELKITETIKEISI